nr:helix-turn-helix domain-containing protein [uncultured Parolsenella sp.]
MQSKWQVLVLRGLLLNGTMRFKELQRSIGKISQRVPTDNLRALEDYGIVHREVFAEVPPRVEHSLTETGQSLRTVIDAIWTWGEEHKERLRLQDK